jgi:hypothetical protein
MQESVCPVLPGVLRQRQRFIDVRRGCFSFTLSFSLDRS